MPAGFMSKSYSVNFSVWSWLFLYKWQHYY